MNIIKLNPKQILIIILLIGAFLRLYRLDYPNKYVFDEVYHAFTAKEFLAGKKEAWEYWTKPPPGVAYEWTHPPLAKEIMAVSMFLVRSQDAWVWRLPGSLLGILSIYLVYLLGKKLLKKESASLIAAFVFSIDGLNFVQSRTGMNDIYYVTFMLLCLLLLLNKRFLLSAIVLGLALSSKWAALYTYLIIFIILSKNKDFWKILYFIFIPPIIYLISYLPFFLLGHNFSIFISLQQQMWWYHTNLKAIHGYSSPWWSWPLNLYPVWYFVDYQKDKIANIFTSGNPAVFWIGSMAIILTIWEYVKNLFTFLQSKKARFFEASNTISTITSEKVLIIIAGFMAFWLPWAFSPRIMFLYHFAPSVPFLSLALGHQLSFNFENTKTRKIVFVILALLILSFAFLYPFLTGIPIPRDFVKFFFYTNIAKNPF